MPTLEGATGVQKSKGRRPLQLRISFGKLPRRDKLLYDHVGSQALCGLPGRYKEATNPPGGLVPAQGVGLR